MPPGGVSSTVSDEPSSSAGASSRIGPATHAAFTASCSRWTATAAVSPVTLRSSCARSIISRMGSYGHSGWSFTFEYLRCSFLRRERSFLNDLIADGPLIMLTLLVIAAFLTSLMFLFDFPAACFRLTMRGL